MTRFNDTNRKSVGVNDTNLTEKELNFGASEYVKKPRNSQEAD